MAPPEPWEPETWIDEGPVRDAAEAAVTRGQRRPSAPAVPLPDDVRAELEQAAGTSRAPRLAERLDAARRAFERERYPEARRLLASLAAEAPGAASVRELHGLTLYRLGRWREAARELEAYRTLAGGEDQLPVLMDCYRALRRPARVAELWEELRAASPGAAIVAEGRIVMAGTLADGGDLAGALRALEQADAVPTRVREHHLRLWYVLADLAERAGDAPRARRLFARVREHAPGFADVEDRLAALGR